MTQQTTFEDTNPEYAAFVEKFKPKKTTDDCYTPENIYNAVADWAAKKYGFDPAKIVRPFWPGGDYQRENYPKDCVVLDNPPFSILAKITRWYNSNGVRFFLFAPGLTLFQNIENDNFVTAMCSITYANGANVRTSFVTNLGDYLIETAPELHKLIDDLDKQNQRAKTKELPKYEYPDAVITAAKCGYFSIHGTDFRVKRSDALFIRYLDQQRKEGSSIFGGGFLLSERAAKERAAAELAAAENAAKERAAAAFALEHGLATNSRGAICWELSEREKQLQQLMAKN